jgi:hypothetical protein
LKIDRIDLGDLPETQPASRSKIVNQIQRVEFQIDEMRKLRVMLNPMSPKLNILGLAAAFAPFHGYSLLFDNPYETYELRSGLVYVNCTGSANPPFYKLLFESLDALGMDRLRVRFSLCLLPTSSAHVTALDGHSPDNMHKVDPDNRDRIRNLIDEMPSSMSRAVAALPEFYNSRLATEKWPIDFVFDELAIWKGLAFVAKLKPADELSRIRLTELEKARTEISRDFPHLGLSAGVFSGHASLGYFADPRLGELAKLYLPYWTEVIADRMRGTKLSFRTVSLHGFTDMATFFKLPIVPAA